MTDFVFVDIDDLPVDETEDLWSPEAIRRAHKELGEWKLEGKSDV